MDSIANEVSRATERLWGDSPLIGRILETNMSSGDHEEVSVGEHDGVHEYGMIFVLYCIFAGICTKIFQRKFTKCSPPLVVVLLVLGAITGVLDNSFNMGPFSESIHEWENMNPHALLTILLPPLLFSSASTIDFHVFRKVGGQAVLLAGPGVLLSIFLTAWITMSILEPGWSFLTAALFSSMFAATDPVAVVALLKDLGAPETLSVLIEGESLLNDGTAFALFILFTKEVSGVLVDATPLEVMYEVLYISVVGCAIGTVLGFACIYTIGYIWNEPVLEICVTVVFAWGSFILGEAVHASGVLAVVTLGVAFASQSVSYISAEVQTAMHEFWHIMEFIANCLVFTLSGVICAKNILQSEFLSGQHLGYLIVLYIILNLIRAVMIATFYFPLKHMGYGMDWKQALLISWSGLRGAVGLLAALLLDNEKTCEEKRLENGCLPRDLQGASMFYMSGIVMLTILVNGTTTDFLVKKLGIAKRSWTASQNYNAALNKLRQKISSSIADSKTKKELIGADWNLVWANMPNFAMEGETPDAAIDPMLGMAPSQTTNQKSGTFSEMSVTPDEAIMEIRFRFLNFVKASYKYQFRYGSVGSWPILRILTEAASVAQDDLTQPLDEWNGFLLRYCRIEDSAKSSNCILNKICTKSTRRQVATAFDIAHSFVQAHEFAGSKICRYAANFGEVNDMIRRECDAMISSAKEFMESISCAYEEITASIKTGMAVSFSLTTAGELANRMHEKSELDDHDFEYIQEVLNHRVLSLRRSQGYVQVRSAKDLFASLPFFEGVDAATMKRVHRHCQLHTYKKGHKLMEHGKEATTVFLILRGRVKLTIVCKKVKELNDHEKQMPNAGERILHTAGSFSSAASHNARLLRQGSTGSFESHINTNRSSSIVSTDSQCFGQQLGSIDDIDADFVLEENDDQDEEDEAEKVARKRPNLSILTDDHNSSVRGDLDSPNKTNSRYGPQSPGCASSSIRSLDSAIVGDDKDSSIIQYWCGRGQTLGELEALAHCDNVADVTCESLVEVYELEKEWFMRFFLENPGHRLEQNFILHAAMIALETFYYPILQSSPESVRPYILSKLQIFRTGPDGPSPPTMPLEEGGVGILLRGSLVKVGGKQLDTPVAPVTVFEMPRDYQSYSENTLLVLLPANIVSLFFGGCETIPQRNGRSATVAQKPGGSATTSGTGNRSRTRRHSVYS